VAAAVRIVLLELVVQEAVLPEKVQVRALEMLVMQTRVAAVVTQVVLPHLILLAVLVALEL
jgi:hypothetical protein